MKVYYFISSISHDDFMFFHEKISSIKNVNDVEYIRSTHTFKIGNDEKDKTQSTAFLEACTFLKYFLGTYNGSIEDIIWVRKNNFLAFNNDVFILEKNTWSKLEEETLFVTSRDMWLHPFFYYLLSGSFSQNIKFIKPNASQKWQHYDKLYFNQKVWRHREKYLGNIVIPFLMDSNESTLFHLLNFVNENIGNRYVIKNNFGVEGYSVKAIKHSSILSHGKILDLKNRFFKSKKIYGYHTAFFSEFYDIKTEFRLYYTNYDNEIKIFSVKHKSYDIHSKENIFSAKDLSRKELKTLWSYCPKDVFNTEYKYIREESEKLIKLLGLETGVLEVCELNDGTFRFIELNPMGGALMFPGEDEKNIESFYNDIWSKLFKDLI